MPANHLQILTQSWIQNNERKWYTLCWCECKMYKVHPPLMMHWCVLVWINMQLMDWCTLGWCTNGLLTHWPGKQKGSPLSPFPLFMLSLVGEKWTLVWSSYILLLRMLIMILRSDVQCVANSSNRATPLCLRIQHHKPRGGGAAPSSSSPSPSPSSSSLGQSRPMAGKA